MSVPAAGGGEFQPYIVARRFAPLEPREPRPTFIWAAVTLCHSSLIRLDKLARHRSSRRSRRYRLSCFLRLRLHAIHQVCEQLKPLWILVIERLRLTNSAGGGDMSFLVWIVLGLVAGFIASKVVNKQGEGMLLDTVLGVVGAVVGGWIFGLLGARGASGLNLYSLLVAVVGAIVVLFTYHAIRRSV